MASTIAYLAETLTVVLERSVVDDDEDRSTASAIAAALASLAVCAFHNLSWWALNNGFDDGRVDLLSDADLAMIAEPGLVASDLASPREIGSMLREAMLKGGVIVEAEGRQVIADFADDNRKLLGDRKRKRAERQRRASKASSDRPGTDPGSSSERLSQQEQEQEREPAPEPEPEPESEEEENRSLPDGESDDLLQDLLKASMWNGRVETMSEALDQLRARGLPDDEIRRRLRGLGSDAIGLKPYDLRDRLLAEGQQAARPYTLPAAPQSQDADEYQRQQALADGVAPEERDRQVREWVDSNMNRKDVS